MSIRLCEHFNVRRVSPAPTSGSNSSSSKMKIEIKLTDWQKVQNWVVAAAAIAGLVLTVLGWIFLCTFIINFCKTRGVTVECPLNARNPVYSPLPPNTKVAELKYRVADGLCCISLVNCVKCFSWYVWDELTLADFAILGNPPTWLGTIDNGLELKPQFLLDGKTIDKFPPSATEVVVRVFDRHGIIQLRFTASYDKCFEGWQAPPPSPTSPASGDNDPLLQPSSSSPSFTRTDDELMAAGLLGESAWRLSREKRRGAMAVNPLLDGISRRLVEKDTELRGVETKMQDTLAAQEARAAAAQQQMQSELAETRRRMEEQGALIERLLASSTASASVSSRSDGNGPSPTPPPLPPQPTSGGKPTPPPIRALAPHFNNGSAFLTVPAPTAVAPAVTIVAPATATAADPADVVVSDGGGVHAAPSSVSDEERLLGDTNNNELSTRPPTPSPADADAVAQTATSTAAAPIAEEHNEPQQQEQESAAAPPSSLSIGALQDPGLSAVAVVPPTADDDFAELAPPPVVKSTGASLLAPAESAAAYFELQSVLDSL